MTGKVMMGWDGREYHYRPTMLEEWVDRVAGPVRVGLNLLEDRIFLSGRSGNTAYQRHPMGFLRRFPHRRDPCSLGPDDYVALCSDMVIHEHATYDDGKLRLEFRFNPDDGLLLVSDGDSRGRMVWSRDSVIIGENNVVNGMDIRSMKMNAISFAESYLPKSRLEKYVSSRA